MINEAPIKEKGLVRATYELPLTMQLLGLMGSYSAALDWAGRSVEVGGISPDSDRVLPGYLFVALPGSGEDGHRRVYQALQRGAVAVLGEWHPDDLSKNLPWGVSTFVRVLDAVKAWFWLSGHWSCLCTLGADPTHERATGNTIKLPGLFEVMEMDGAKGRTHRCGPAA
ncbi:hypothetical protein ACFLWA_07540 [Chloroflexota bacterium]